MRHVAFLLLDGTSSDLGGRLRRALETPLVNYSPPYDTCSIDVCPDAAHAARAARENGPAVLFALIPAGSVEASVKLVRSIALEGSPPVVLVTPSADPGELWQFLKAGAADFLTPPLDAATVLPRIWRLVALEQAAETTHHIVKSSVALKQLLGESAAMAAVKEKIPLIARCDACVLITGETGTGKELCARAIHYLSARMRKPFVPVNCGAIPPELAENELFGHEGGAFTGAVAVKRGLVREADGGTLFLDEIDSSPLLVQVKLLRFLQDKEYRPLGSSRIRHGNVRILAASNADLSQIVRQGRLRRDLYYRINVLPLLLPPLRDRPEDIALLGRHFVRKYSAEFRRPARDLAPAAVQKLAAYDWPGNVRELEHIIQRAVMIAQGHRVELDDVALPESAQPAGDSFKMAKARLVAHFERSHLQQLLSMYDGNITRAAAAARKNRRAFWELLRKHKIDTRRFKAPA